MIRAAAVQDATRPIGGMFGNERSLTPERLPGPIDRAVSNTDREAYGSG